MSTQAIGLKNFATRGWVLLMVVPTIAMITIFSYYPAIEAMRHSFYNWDGGTIEEFTGLENIRLLLGDLSLWWPLGLSFFCGFLSLFLDHPSVRRVLRGVTVVFLAYTAYGLYKHAQTPAMADKSFWPSLQWGFPWLLCLGYVLGGRKAHQANNKSVKWYSAALLGCYLFPLIAEMMYLVQVAKMGDWLFWLSFRLIFILVVANVVKMLPSVFTAICVHRLKSEGAQYFYRVMFVIPMIIPQLVGLLIWKFFYDPNVGPLNKLLIITHMDKVLIWLDTWVLHWGAFTEPFKPAWLGEPSLIIPALIFWGFPWVGVVGVLIYLSGLQNIGTEVYEAAELDGIGWWGKFIYIELPLIMTQIRLNLILLVIGTFQAWSFQFLLLGSSGGPENKGLTPGLYMYYKGFETQNFGYACAVGLVLFFIIMALTMINQKYVRVEK